MIIDNKVSVIIPVYNVEKYLHKCLDSVISQTYENIEIICVDDCSTDSSATILQEYAQKDSRFVIVKQERNQGLGVTRNNAISIATGKYVIFVDSEDWIDSNLITKCYNLMQQNDYNFIEFGTFVVTEDEKITGVLEGFLTKNRSNILKLVDNPEYSFFKNCQVWNRFYNLEFLKKHDILNSTARFWEDPIFSIKAKILSKHHTIIDDAFYFYRQRETSLTKCKKLDMSELFKSMSDTNRFFLSIPDKEKYRVCYENFLCSNLSNLSSRFTEDKLKTLEEFIKQNLSERIYLSFTKLFHKKKRFPGKSKHFLEKIFSVKNSTGRTHKVITILGIKIRIRMSEHKYNHVYIVKNGIRKKVKEVEGIKFCFEGQGAVVELGAEPLPRFKNVELHLGDDSMVSIESSKYSICNCQIHMEAKRSRLFINKDLYCPGSLSIYNMDESGLTMKIGKNCMFALGVIMRPCDGHAIYNNDTKTIINKPEYHSIEIGNHVWCGMDVKILKNTKIPDNSIVGAGAIVNKKFEEKNVIIAGVPAGIIKRNINWSIDNTDQFTPVKRGELDSE